MQKKFEMKGQETIQEILDFNCETLKNFKLDSKERLRTELTFEEVLMRLIEHGDFEEKKNISISINKFLGNVSIDLRVPGSDFEFLPRLDFYDIESDDGTVENIQNMLLRSLGERISFRHSVGYNTVRIQVYRSQYFNLYLILSSVILAIITGIAAKNLFPEHICGFFNDNILQSFISLFMNGLKMCAVPVVFLSIVSCFTKADSLAGIKRIGIKLFVFYSFFMILSASLGYFAVQLLKPGAGIHLTTSSGSSEAAAGSMLSMRNVLVDVVPSNIIRPFAEGNMIQLIILAILVGVACGACRIKIITSIFDELNRIFLKIIGFFMQLIPLFVFCAVSSMIITTGSKVLLSVLGLFYTNIFGVLLLFIAYCIVFAVLGFNPFRVLKKSMQMLLTAFTTASSIACMPDAMKISGELGVEPKMYNFSVPIGITLFKSTFPIMAIVFVCSSATIYGIDLTLSKIISVAFSSIVLIMAMPGIPGVTLILMSTLLAMAGCPAEALGLVVGIDPIIDMFFTPVGVLGVMASILTVAKSEKMLDK